MKRGRHPPADSAQAQAPPALASEACEGASRVQPPCSSLVPAHRMLGHSLPPMAISPRCRRNSARVASYAWRAGGEGQASGAPVGAGWRTVQRSWIFFLWLMQEAHLAPTQPRPKHLTHHRKAVGKQALLLSGFHRRLLGLAAARRRCRRRLGRRRRLLGGRHVLKGSLHFHHGHAHGQRLSAGVRRRGRDQPASARRVQRRGGAQQEQARARRLHSEDRPASGPLATSRPTFAGL